MWIIDSVTKVLTLCGDFSDQCNLKRFYLF